MEIEQYPLLTALYARGPAAFTGEPLSYLLIEVRGGNLYITGATPLRSAGDHYTESGWEYCYVLDSGEAEKLLESLVRYHHKRPEEVIAGSFEFFRPQCLLKDYMDSLEITYQYHATEPERL